MNTQNQHKDDKPFKVRRGRVDSVDLYEVKENELEILANGEPTGIYLNFSIFLISIAISCVIALFTATFESSLVENAFLFVSIIGFLGGFFIGILWWRGRKSIKAIITKIKDRIPPDSSIINFYEEETEIIVDISNENAPKG